MVTVATPLAFSLMASTVFAVAHLFPPEFGTFTV